MNEPAERMPSDAELSAWILRHPEAWVEPTADDVARADALLRSVRSGERLAFHRRELRRRRRTLAAMVVGAVAAGGAVGAAALVRSGQPDRAEQGVVCRAAATLDADAMVLPLSSDPVGACADAWASGTLTAGRVPETPSQTPEQPADLTACVGDGRAVEVFPDGEEVCDRLGLVPLDPKPDGETLLVGQLADRIATEVNLADCADAATVAGEAQRILDEVGLAGWTVKIDPSADGATCMAVAIDSSTRTLTVRATRPR